MSRKNRKGLSIALTMIFLMTVLLSGCAQAAQQETTDEANTEKAPLCTSGGKVLNIYCWNTEFKETPVLAS